MEEQQINALINIGQSKVVEKAHDDILIQPNKKVSNALSTIIDISNTVLWPVKWINERTRIYFENNLKKYQERLEPISEDKIVEVPTEISKPLLDRFSYVSNEELSNAFVGLLVSASSTDTINLAHPSFISVIDRLSPDEAKILTYFKDRDAIPKVDIKRRDLEGKSTYYYIVQNETGIQNEIILTFPENINLYLNNLESLGIIQLVDYFYTSMEAKFTQIINSLEDKYNKYKLEGDTDEKHQQRKSVEQGMYQVTSYGKMFIKACIN